MEGHRVKLTEVNPYLVCVLCHGYLVDATTIAECLHSFCRSCIFRQLERKPICPICETQVHNTKLYRSLRPDKTLQDIVYKLVPGLFHNEMQRRRDFYKNHPYRDEHLEPECRGVGLDRLIYSPDDLISLSLEFYDDEREKEEWSNQGSPKPAQTAPSGPKRYLQCPAGFKMRHLKKFLRQKYGLSSTFNIDILYKRETLPDSYSLMDVAYIYTWKRNSPMRFYYRMPEVVMKQLMNPPPEVPLITNEEVEKKDESAVCEKEVKTLDEATKIPEKSENKENESENLAVPNKAVEDIKIPEQSVKIVNDKKAEVVAPADSTKPEKPQNGEISISKQDELPVSVLLSLGQSRVSDKSNEHKFLVPPVPLKNGLTEKKNKVNAKISVNKIATDLAENKTQGIQPVAKENSLLTPSPTPHQQLVQKQKQIQLQKQNYYQKQKQLQIKQQAIGTQKQQQISLQKQKQQQLQLKQQQLAQQKQQIQHIIQQQQLQHQLQQQQLQQFHQQQLQQLQTQQQLQAQQSVILQQNPLVQQQQLPVVQQVLQVQQCVQQPQVQTLIQPQQVQIAAPQTLTQPQQNASQVEQQPQQLANNSLQKQKLTTTSLQQKQLTPSPLQPQQLTPNPLQQQQSTPNPLQQQQLTNPLQPQQSPSNLQQQPQITTTNPQQQLQSQDQQIKNSVKAPAQNQNQGTPPQSTQQQTQAHNGPSHQQASTLPCPLQGQRPTPPPLTSPPPQHASTPPPKVQTPPTQVQPASPKVAVNKAISKSPQPSQISSPQNKSENVENKSSQLSTLSPSQFHSNFNLMSGGNINTLQNSMQPKSPQTSASIQPQKSWHELSRTDVHGLNTSPKTKNPQVTLNTSNGSLTIMAQPKTPQSLSTPVVCNPDTTSILNGKATEGPRPQGIHQNLPRTVLPKRPLVNGKTYQKAVPQKNISGQRLNNNLMEMKNGLIQQSNINNRLPTFQKTGNARKTIPGGVVSKTGPTLDQRIQQLYNAGQTNKPSSPADGTKSESRLASWLNNRFKPPPTPKEENDTNEASPKSDVSVMRYKRKLQELQKDCEITQENPRPDDPKRRREVMPDVSIELMRAADMKKLEGVKKEKRPVPGLKSIQEVGTKRKKEEDSALDLSSAKPGEELRPQLPWLVNRPPHFIPRPT